MARRAPPRWAPIEYAPPEGVRQPAAHYAKRDAFALGRLLVVLRGSSSCLLDPAEALEIAPLLASNCEHRRDCSWLLEG